MSHKGDEKLQWDPKSGPSCSKAEARFNELRQAGHLAFKLDKRDGSQGEMVTAFDPNEEEIIFTPPLKGG